MEGEGGVGQGRVEEGKERIVEGESKVLLINSSIEREGEGGREWGERRGDIIHEFIRHKRALSLSL